jgi:hypothetical protein
MGTETRFISLRYAATCGSCNTQLPRGTLAAWDRETKTATCSACLASSVASDSESTLEVDRGLAGGSARREFERRHKRRESRIRQRHKRLGGVILALSSALRAEGIAALHDRRIPGSKANIDHIAISPAGLFVVDPKNYRGRVEQRDVGGLFRTDLRLYVGGRDKTNLVKGMDRQVNAVRAALAQDEKWSDVPVTPVLLFTSAENWSWLNFRPLRFGETYVLWGEAFGKLLHAEEKIPHDAVVELERLLADALPTR